MKIEIDVNNTVHEVVIEPNALLVTVLRENLHLTGAHVGCDTSQCGACTVHLDGRAVKSCAVLAVQVADAKVVTIEGIGEVDNLHPMQTAFREHHALQCGFCTPGMIMQAIDLVTHEDNLNRDKIRQGLEGNLCRCTGYHNIVSAIEVSLACAATGTSAASDAATSQADFFRVRYFRFKFTRIPPARPHGPASGCDDGWVQAAWRTRPATAAKGAGSIHAAISKSAARKPCSNRKSLYRPSAPAASSLRKVPRLAGALTP